MKRTTSLFAAAVLTLGGLFVAPSVAEARTRPSRPFHLHCVSQVVQVPGPVVSFKRVAVCHRHTHR